jgi:hypothetical protein
MIFGTREYVVSVVVAFGAMASGRKSQRMLSPSLAAQVPPDPTCGGRTNCPKFPVVPEAPYVRNSRDRKKPDAFVAESASGRKACGTILLAVVVPCAQAVRAKSEGKLHPGRCSKKRLTSEVTVPAQDAISSAKRTRLTQDPDGVSNTDNKARVEPELHLEKKVKVELNTPDIAPACVLAASSINKSSIKCTLAPIRDISTELAVTKASPARYQKPSAGSQRFGLPSDSILKELLCNPNEVRESLTALTISQLQHQLKELPKVTF